MADDCRDYHSERARAEHDLALKASSADARRVEREADFLFDPARLNVAFSRAIRLCILVAGRAIAEPPLSVLATPARQAAWRHLQAFRATCDEQQTIIKCATF